MVLSVDNINIDRDDLASFLPNLRSIKSFENLAKAVGGTIPDQVNANQSDIEALQFESASSVAQSLAALADAATALLLAQDAQAQALTGQVSALIAEVAELRVEINNLKQGYFQ